MTSQKIETLQREFAQAVNRNSVEADSNTPDFLLGELAVSTLNIYACAINGGGPSDNTPLENFQLGMRAIFDDICDRRTKWHGVPE